MNCRFPIADFRFLFTALCCLFFAHCASAALDVAVIELVNDVDEIRYARTAEEFDRLEPIRFYRWESVQFYVTALHGETPVALTNDGIFVRWEAYQTPGSSNAYIHKAGSVVSSTGGRTLVELTPAEAGLPPGEYYSYLRAFQVVDGTNRFVGVLAHNRLEVLWSPDTEEHAYQGPWPMIVYTNSAEIIGQVSAVSNRVIALETVTNNWNAAFSWGDHAGLYLGLTDWATQSNLLWQAIAGATDTNALPTSVFNIYTNAQHAVNTNYAQRIDALEENVVYRTDMDGGWYYPDWFQWSFTQTADGMPDQTSVVTNNDVIINREIYDAIAGSFTIEFSGLRSDGFSSPVVTSASPSIATATVDKVWYVSAGTATVSATVGDFSRSTNLVMQMVSMLTNDVATAAVAGSAVAAFADAIDTRLTDGTDKAVYSVQDHTAANYVRNSSGWVADIDLTCVSPWNSLGGRYRAGTLIGADCIIHADHYPISLDYGPRPWKPGASLRFVTSSNTVVTRTITALVAVPGTDFLLGKLDSPISTNDCRPALLLPGNHGEYMIWPNSYDELRPGLFIDQYENAYVGNLTSLSYNSTWRPSTNATRALYWKLPIDGDSGSPMLLIAPDGRPIITGTFYSPLGGPSVGYRTAAIRAGAASLGCDTNSIVDADFATLGFTNFNPGPPTF